MTSPSIPKRKNTRTMRIKNLLLVLTLLTERIKGQSSYYLEVSLEEIRGYLPKIQEVRATFKYDYTGSTSNPVNLNVMLYEDLNVATGLVESKATIVEIKYNAGQKFGVKSRLNQNDPLPYVKNVQKTDDYHYFERSDSPDFYFFESFNRDTNTLKFYDINLDEYSDPLLTGMSSDLHPILLVKVMVRTSDSFLNQAYFFFVHEKKLRKVTVGPTGEISVEDFNGELEVENIKEIQASYRFPGYGLFVFGDTTKIYEFYGDDLNSLVLVPSLDGDTEVDCDYIERVSGPLYCFKNGKEVTKFRITSGKFSFVDTYSSNYKLWGYFQTGLFSIHNTYYTDSPKLRFVRGQKEDGRIGISYTNLDYSEEVAFVEEGREQFSIMDRINCKPECNIAMNESNDAFRIYRFSSLSTVENCESSSHPKAIFNQDCYGCRGGFSLDSSGATPVCNKACTGQNVIFKEEEGCVQCPSYHHCADCNYISPVCNTCLEGYEPNLPLIEGEPFCREKTCPSNSFWNGECASCLEANNCEECQFPNGDCSRCASNHFLEPSGLDSKVCHPCNSLIENCSECSSSTACGSCVEGYVVDIQNPGKCLLEDVTQISLSLSEPTNSCNIVIRIYPSNSQGEEVDPRELMDSLEESLVVSASHSASPDEELVSQVFLNKRNEAFICISFSEEIKKLTENEEFGIKVKSKTQSLKTLNINKKENVQESSDVISISPSYRKESSASPSEVEGLFSTMFQESPMKDVLSTLVIFFDPGTMLLRLSQLIKLANRFVFINMNFGKKLTGFLESIAGVQEESPNKEQPSNRLLLENNSKGKLTKYTVSTKLNGSLVYKIAAYFLIWVIRALKFLIKISKNFFSKKPQIKNTKKWKNILWQIFDKMQIAVLTSIPVDIIFYGGRILLYKEDNSALPKLDQIVIIACFLLILFDLHSVLTNIEKLVFLSNKLLKLHRGVPEGGNLDNRSRRERVKFQFGLNPKRPSKKKSRKKKPKKKKKCKKSH